MLVRYRLLWTVAIVVVVLVAARIALPYVLKDQVNKGLMALPNYDGHVEEVDVALWRGAYGIEGVTIEKTGAEKQATPFFQADRIDFSVEWRHLLRGRIVAECELFAPKLNLVRAESADASQLGTGVNWGGQLENLFPFRFNTVRAHGGTITFRAPGIAAKDALVATQVEGEITNMTNVVPAGQEAFAGFRGTATVLGNGSAAVAGRANPWAKTPTFDVNLTVKNVQLPKVNPWLREYIKADAESGDFELYTELAAADGKFEGYAKPIMREVDIYRSGEPEKNPFKRLWEGLVDFAAEVLEDDESGQVAARIPFSGTIEDPDAGLLETVVSVLHNAFVSAFARSLEGSVSIRDVKENIKELGQD
ncbi:MAG TPA: DUF748 domain-containing protein [Steroidobacteraceae bacterium]|nr:DUF748 domain-containing protein [Steroidobacteraceae bacterium]